MTIHVILRPIALAVVAIVASMSAAIAACPSSEVTLAGFGPILSTSTTYDSTYGSAHVSFDVSLGRLMMDQQNLLAPTLVKVRDAFDVIGVPTGTPVAVTAQLYLDGYVSTPGCGGTGCGGILADSL